MSLVGRKCAYCSKDFESKAWNALTCSTRCSQKNWRKNNPDHNRQIKMAWRRKQGVLERGSPEHRAAVSEQLLGGKLTDATRRSIKGSALRGDAHHAWKGDNVSYRSLHKWVERYLGKPSTCTNCLATGLFGRKIHWSNISGEYYRELSDWQRLCAKCHKDYDLKLKERIAISS